MNPTGVVPPPPRWAPRRSDSNNPKCGVCSKPLNMNDVRGVDKQLGIICRECAPHVVAAHRLLHPFYI